MAATQADRMLLSLLSSSRSWRIGRFVSAVVIPCIWGCVGANTFVVSSATTVNGGTKVNKFGELSAAGVGIIVRPDNAIRTAQSQGVGVPFATSKFDQGDYRFSPIYYKNSALDTRDPFVVEILIATRDREVEFNPLAIELISGKWAKKNPVSYFTLAPRYATTRFLNPVTPLCRRPDRPAASVDYPLLPQYERASSEPMRLPAETLHCVAVKFDIPPLDPRTTFSITINNLSVSGQKVVVPVISFAPGDYVQKVN